jgi:hypothetical protein
VAVFVDDCQAAVAVLLADESAQVVVEDRREVVEEVVVAVENVSGHPATASAARGLT